MRHLHGFDKMLGCEAVTDKKEGLGVNDGALMDTKIDKFARGCYKVIEAGCFPSTEVREHPTYPVSVKE